MLQQDCGLKLVKKEGLDPDYTLSDFMTSI